MWQKIRDSRDHLRKALKRLLDIGAAGHVVFDSLDEGRIRDASCICGGIFAVVNASVERMWIFQSIYVPEFDLFSHIYFVILCFVAV